MSDIPRQFSGYKLNWGTKIRSWRDPNIADGMTRQELGYLVTEFNERFAYQLLIYQSMEIAIRDNVTFYVIKKDSCMKEAEQIARDELDGMNHFVLGFMKACQAIRRRIKQK